MNVLPKVDIFLNSWTYYKCRKYESLIKSSKLVSKV